MKGHNNRLKFLLAVSFWNSVFSDKMVQRTGCGQYFVSAEQIFVSISFRTYWDWLSIGSRRPIRRHKRQNAKKYNDNQLGNLL
jgi:hypothetical protein